MIIVHTTQHIKSANHSGRPKRTLRTPRRHHVLRCGKAIPQRTSMTSGVRPGWSHNVVARPAPRTRRAHPQLSHLMRMPPLPQRASLPPATVVVRSAISRVVTAHRYRATTTVHTAAPSVARSRVAACAHKHCVALPPARGRTPLLPRSLPTMTPRNSHRHVEHRPMTSPQPRPVGTAHHRHRVHRPLSSSPKPADPCATRLSGPTTLLCRTTA